MRFLILFTILFFTQCDIITGAVDARDRLDSTRLYGSWYRISLVKSDACTQCFRLDTAIYQIRELSRSEMSNFQYTRNYEPSKYPLTFDIIHYDEARRAYTVKGYIYNPINDMLDTEPDNYWISCLKYDLMQEEGRDHSYGVIMFSMPVNDSLNVQIGTSSFGLKKAR